MASLNSIFAVAFIVVFLSASVYSEELDYFTASVFYKGDVVFYLDKAEYNAGDAVQTEITAANLEDFPIENGYLVVEVVRGGKNHVYPSQLNDDDNVVYETIIPDLDIEAKSQLRIPFTYQIPIDAKSGNYRLEVYYETDRTPINGMPQIFMSPRHRSFTVTGSGEFPSAEIVRTKTTFANEAGPVGVGVASGSQVNGSVYIRLLPSSVTHNLTLKVTVCGWDDTSCTSESVTYRKDYFIKPFYPNVSGSVPVNFMAPQEAGAYAIRLELLDETNRTVSLYRSRIVVYGGAARIRKLAADKSTYQAGDDGSILVLLGASPDHYTNPVLRNVVLNVSILVNESITYSSSYVVPELSDAVGLVAKKFIFRAEKNLDSFMLCASVKSGDGEKLDEYCIPYGAKLESSAESYISSTWAYSGNTLKFSLCSENSIELPAAALLYKNGTLIDAVDNLVLAPCELVSFDASPGDYVLVANDLATNRQYSFDVLAQEGPSMCGNRICEKDEEVSCCNDCGCAEGKECASNVCVEKTNPTTTVAETSTTVPATAGGEDGGGTDYLPAVLIIAVLAAGAYYITRRKK